MGKIVVVPFCVSDLQFTDNDKADKFWRHLLGDIHVLPETKPNGQPVNQSYSPSYSHDENIETQAGMSVADRLGDVPGAGQFGFSYVVIVLIGMMVIVGPVDWFVLKKLGRQPWTWVTTSGWILLITLSATSLGYVLKSGDLHFRTMRLIDQVGDSTAATADWVGVYSPMTREYALGDRPAGRLVATGRRRRFYRVGPTAWPPAPTSIRLTKETCPSRCGSTSGACDS